MPSVLHTLHSIYIAHLTHIFKIRLIRDAAAISEAKYAKDLRDNGIRMFPNKTDISRWIVELKGPVGTAYEGGTFYLLFEAGMGYP